MCVLVVLFGGHCDDKRTARGLVNRKAARGRSPVPGFEGGGTKTGRGAGYAILRARGPFFWWFGDERTAYGVGKTTRARGLFPVPSFRSGREGEERGGRVCVFACSCPIFLSVSIVNGWGRV